VLLVGAPGESLGAGRVHAYTREPDGSWRERATLTGEQAGESFGGSIADLGDVNGDGFHDLAIGATHHDAAGRRGAGAVYVYFGGRAFHARPDLVLEGGSELAGFGYAVAGIGDVNADGIADFAVGAPGDDKLGPSTGQVEVFLGGRPPSAKPVLTLSPGAPGGQFGIAVTAAGDVNGDGIADYAVGANWCRDGQHPRGRVSVYFGGHVLRDRPDWVLDGPEPDGWFGIVRGVGDLNGDGYDDLVVGAGHATGDAPDAGAAYVYWGGVHPATTPALTLRGNRRGDGFGYSLTALGDVNGDGYPDVVVAESGEDAAAPSAGAVKVYFGGPHMHTRADATFTGDVTNDEFGTSLAEAGDVDGDGLADLFVGSPWAAPHARGGGEAWLVSFQRWRWLRPRTGAALAPGQPFEVRWLGRTPADLSWSADGGARWRPLAQRLGGRDENEAQVRLPANATGAIRLRLSAAEPRLHGVAIGPPLVVRP
jgi:hypothetical protein